jgi:hypothetical protein
MNQGAGPCASRMPVACGKESEGINELRGLKRLHVWGTRGVRGEMELEEAGCSAR